MDDNQGNQNDQGNQDNNNQGNGNQNDQGNNYQNNQGNHGNNNEQDKLIKHIVCPTQTCKDIALAVPVEVHAYADIGDITLKCKDRGIIRKPEKPKSISRFEITQEIFAYIPIDFIVEIEVKDERVDFDMYECK